MASISAIGVVFGLILIFVSIADAQKALPPGYFNVLSYGAISYGRADNSQAFLKAWGDACQWKGRTSVLLIPLGTYMLNSLIFKGPCRSDQMVVLIKGVLMAPTSPSLFFNDTWIGFRYINGLVVEGGGLLDGQGAAAWHYNDCATNHDCRPLPVAGSSAGVRIKNVTFDNIQGTSSSQVAITLNCSTSVPCQNVKLVNINLAYDGPGGQATSTCSNVKGASYGIQLPPSCV